MSRKKMVDNGNQSASMTSELSEIVQESKQELFQAAQVAVKKKPGRPMGSTSQKKNDTEVSPSQVNPQVSTPIGVILPGPSPLRPTLGHTIEYLGSFMAMRTDFDGFAFTPDETKLLADQADEVCKEFIPSVQSKYGKLTVFIGTASVMVANKYNKWQKYLISKIKKKEESNNVSVN